MKTLAVQIPDEVYVRAEQRAAEQGSALAGEVAELVKRYGEGAGPPKTGNGSLPPVAERFRELVRQWKEANQFVSATTDIVMHPAYQQIIGMGPDVLPLIFAELRRQPGQWFWALKAITGEDPVAPADRGKVQSMAKSWLDWAEHRGY
jgi:hypothetical protein